MKTTYMKIFLLCSLFITETTYTETSIYTPFHCIICFSQNFSTKTNDSEEPKLMTRNKWSAIVYRRGQKELTRLFLKEAEHALQLSLNEEEVTSC